MIDKMKKLVPAVMACVGSAVCFAEESGTQTLDIADKIDELTTAATSYATSIGIASLTILGIFFGVRFIKSRINLAK